MPITVEPGRAPAAWNGPGEATLRSRLEGAIAGEVVHRPVYAVYDWFVRNRRINWQSLFDHGLGQINHADLIQFERPHVQIVETRTPAGEVERRDVRWITDRGELHEWYLGEWRQEYLIKSAQDYRIMQRAWEDTAVTLSDKAFLESEHVVGAGGITLAQLDRTPFQKIQIDYAGLERFSMDIADRVPELLDLIERMNEIKFAEFRLSTRSQAGQIKLWENLTIETMGPRLYRQHLVPVYRRIFEILEGSGKKLQVHYDGKLRIIAEEIQGLPFDGLDSVTPPPEGDITTAEARWFFPDKFLWLHPTLNWYSLPPADLVHNIRKMVRAAGPRRFCLMISEEVPPNWQERVPLILKTLDELD